MQKYARLRCFHQGLYRLIFTKLSANVERLVGFIIVYSTSDGLIKGRSYGNQFVACVGEN